MKVLIFYSVLSDRHGGPPTYLYNLRQSAVQNDVSISFLSDYIKSDYIVKANSLKKKLATLLNPNLVALYQMYNLKNINEHALRDININNYDVIHFHSTFDFYKYHNYLRKNFQGKILLTTHSPKAYHLEYIEEILKTKISKIWNFVLKKLAAIDEFSFRNADALIFPCEESLEPYYNTWSDFRNIIKNKKIGFFLTASPQSVVKKNSLEIRRSLDIPDDAFVISYAGRHNHVKGYDLLREMGLRILKNKNFKNVYFLILGKEEPLGGLSDSRWIEVGWTTDPHSYISASNLFILPNRETFFDLILIEVLSLGKLLLLSKTGGNRFFSRFIDSGIFFFRKENISDMEEQLNLIISKSIGERKILEEVNSKLYSREFSLNNFALNYLDCLNKLFMYD